MSGGEGMGPHGCMEEKGLPLALNALSPQPGTWGKHYLDRGKRGAGTGVLQLPDSVYPEDINGAVPKYRSLVLGGPGKTWPWAWVG